MTLDELVIEMSVDSDKVGTGINKAKEAISGFSNFIAGVGMSFGMMFGGMIQKAIASIPNMLREMKEEAKALDDINKKTGASVEDVYAWGSAVELSGGSVKSFQNTLVHLYNDMSRLSITGRSRSKPFLEALGLNAAEVSKKPILDAIKDISKAVEGMDTQKSSHILKNLGFDPDTIKFMQGGQIDELITKQKELGGYTTKDIEVLDKMEKITKRLSHTFKSLLIPIFSRVISVIEKFATYFEKAVDLMLKNTDVLKGALLALALVFSGPLISAIVAFTSMLLANPIMLVVAAIGTLLLLLEDLWVYANGGESAFEGLWEKLGTPDEVLAGFEKVGEALEALADILTDDENQMVGFFALLAGLIVALVGAIGWVPIAIAAAVAFIIGYGKEIFAAFKFFKDAIFDIFDKLPAFIRSVLGALSSEITAFFTDPIGTIMEKWEGLKTWFKDNFGSMDAIINRLTSSGASAQMAKEHGESSNVQINDGKVTNIYPQTAEASRAAVREANKPVPQAARSIQ